MNRPPSYAPQHDSFHRYFRCFAPPCSRTSAPTDCFTLETVHAKRTLMKYFDDTWTGTRGRRDDSSELLTLSILSRTSVVFLNSRVSNWTRDGGCRNIESKNCTVDRRDCNFRNDHSMKPVAPMYQHCASYRR